MKWLMPALCMSMAGAGLHADMTDDILGDWRYDGFIYEGKRYPHPNPDLVLTFTFYPNGTNRLNWVRKSQDVTCERKADYSLNPEGKLKQKVTWLNPRNHSSCSQDPDMQLGRETEDRIYIHDDEMGIYMDLNNSELIYLLKRPESTTMTSGSMAR
ncbi:MAG: hypothetical protein HC902_03895 [Calothrix sp. SM1_5_4]|nr:hypothetical protein [Calothrix sp. SM1_5_4]